MATTTLDVLMKFNVDQKSKADARKEAATLTRELSRMLSDLKIDWTRIAKHSTTNLRNLQDMATAAKTFADRMKSSTRETIQHLTGMKDELEGLHEQLEGLNDQLGKATSDAQKVDITQEMTATKKKISDLNKQIDLQRSMYAKEIRELNNLTKAQKRYQAQVSDAAKYGAGDMFKEVGRGFQGLFRGDLKGGLSSIFKGFGKGIGGKVARGAQTKAAAAGGAGTAGGAAEIAGAARALSAAGATFAIAAVGIAAFAKVIAMASDHMAKLNRTMLNGVGFVNDMGAGAESYTRTIDEMRNAVIDSQRSMLRFGANSEDTMKVLNAYTKEASGSIIQTRNQMLRFGMDTENMGNRLSEGVEKFARSAIVYGKALGMEGEEVGKMMGQFQTEIGYGADQTIDLMGNIVKAAATANMPMTKFMGIFRSVLPDVELYQNRLEELTGTIKLLSQTMSAKDVKNFMDAFSKGFKGMDFKQRLKVALVAGTGFVSKTLSKDFDMKAKVMAKNFKQYGMEDPKEFEKAYKGGTATMAAYIAKAQGKAAARGAKISGAEVGNAMKLASYEAARRKGGPLNIATAMRGGGTYATYKILSKFGQTLTTGFDGLSEHVMKQLGITEQQYDALRTTAQSLQAQKAMLERYGKTNSASMNKNLKEVIATRKGIQTSEVTFGMMRKATDEDLFMASELSSQMEKADDTSEQMAVAQANAILSITDILKNVIAFWLEKLFQVISPLEKWIKDLLGWFTGGEDNKNMIEAVRKDMKAAGDTTAAGMQYKLVGEAVVEGLQAGKTGEDLAKAVAASGTLSADQLKEAFFREEHGRMYGNEKLTAIGKAKGMKEYEIGNLIKEMGEALKKGDVAKAIQVTADKLDMSTEQAAMFLAENVKPSEEAAKRLAEAGEIAAGRRAGTAAPKKTFMTKEQREEAKKAADIATLTDVTDWNAKVTDDVAAKIEKTGDKIAAAGTVAPTTGPLNAAAPAGAPAVVQQQMADKLTGGNVEALPEVLKAGVAPAAAAATGGAGAAAAEAKVARGGAAAKTTAVDKTSRGDLLAGIMLVADDTEIIASYIIDLETIGDNVLSVQDSVDDVVDVVDNILTKLKGGVDFTGGFTSGAYATVIKDSTLESFRTALMEFAIIYAKMWKDSKFQEALISGGAAYVGAGGGMSDLIKHIATDDPMARATRDVLGRQDFGSDRIAQTGLYYLQQGEAVISAAEAKRGKVASVTNNVVINAANLPADELQHAVERGIHNAMRKT